MSEHKSEALKEHLKEKYKEKLKEILPFIIVTIIIIVLIGIGFAFQYNKETLLYFFNNFSFSAPKDIFNDFKNWIINPDDNLKPLRNNFLIYLLTFTLIIILTILFFYYSQNKTPHVIYIIYSRKIKRCIDAILDGSILKSKFTKDPVFGFEIPDSLGSVPPNILNPRNAWADPAAYDLQAQDLAKLFNENFAKFKNVSPAIQNAGPRI
jgi:heme/copper-type cytochrome/quinol oxidase subunit 4